MVDAHTNNITINISHRTYENKESKQKITKNTKFQSIY